MLSVPSVSASTNLILLQKTIAILARLHAFLASTGTCIPAHGSEKSLQTFSKSVLYIRVFFMYPTVTSGQLTQKIEVFVYSWCPKKLTVFLFSVHKPNNLDFGVESDHVPSYSKSIYSFFQYTSHCSTFGIFPVIQSTSSVGITHDCFIIKFDASENKILSFETYLTELVLVSNVKSRKQAAIHAPRINFSYPPLQLYWSKTTFRKYTNERKLFLC